jgi:F-type H+-transporting ATPase subunit delta
LSLPERISTLCKATRIVIQTAIARRYAKALFTLLKPSDIQSAAESLTALAGALAVSRELRALLQNPIIGRDKKAAVIRELASKAGASPIMERFLAQVVQKNRIALLVEIRDAFARLADQASNRRVVQLSSARPFSEDSRAAIRGQLERATRSAVDLTTRVDPGLLGGLEIRIGSTVYDGTIRGRLEQMRTALRKEI